MVIRAAQGLPLLLLAPIFQQMPGAQGRDHPTIRGAGHFIQEDAGEELADHIVRFLQQSAG